MLQSRYHRRHYLVTAPSDRRPRIIARIIIAALAMMIIWYLGSKMLSLFDVSSGRRTSALLTTTQTNSASVQISLQGGDWQRAEDNLKIYPGDAIATRNGGKALITFFDGTRIKFDENSEVMIDRSEKFTGNDSQIRLTLNTGRVWVASPNTLVYSGSVLRQVVTAGFTTDIPPDTSALITGSFIAVVKSAGIGLSVDVLNQQNTNDFIYIGEGQQLTLSDDARTAIASGQDPYSFRDPLTAKTLNDEFLLESYAQLKDVFSINEPAQPGSLVAAKEDLVVVSPENNVVLNSKTVSVTGEVSDRIQTLIINNNITAINPDRTFSAELSLDQETNTIHIEAQDEQGVALARVNRTVKVNRDPYLKTVQIKSPVASGATLTTAEQEIEITGEAPADAASIIVNDYRLQLFKPGNRTWSYLASTKLGNLIQGKNTYAIQAVDAEGRKGPPVFIYIQYDISSATVESSAPPLKQNPPLMPGTLSVSAPVAGQSAEITDIETVIEGITSADTYSISVNGYTLSLYQPGKITWNYIASTQLQTLKEGRNVYRIVSRNREGEILDLFEYVIIHRSPDLAR